MRVAIFSDVHGNAHALEAVLADIDKQGPFDRILFAGDLVFGAASPEECIALLSDYAVEGIYGNTDVFLWETPTVPDHAPVDEKREWEQFFEAVDWTGASIGSEGMDYLKSLPFSLTLSPTINHVDNLLVVHANPKDVLAPILPPEDMQQAELDEIRQPDAEVLPLLHNTDEKTIVIGHVHVPNVRRVGDTTIVNIASVSRPQDGNEHSKYGILTFEDGAWQVEHQYVSYDIEAARKAILDSKMPMAEHFAAQLSGA
jgi:predicted phosphodiesterase